MATKTKNVAFDEVGNFSKFYLDTFYREDPVSDVEVILKFLLQEMPKLPSRSGRMIEVGCGPVLAYALAAAPYIQSIDLADFDAGSLEEIRRWKGQLSPYADWSSHTKFILAEEGGDPKSVQEITERETLLREKIGTIQFCDLTRPSPLEIPSSYSVVSCFYCTEQAARSKDQWESVVGHLTSLVEPKGSLFLCFVNNSDNYCFYDDSGTKLQINIPVLCEDDIKRVLPPLGFPLASARIETQAFGGLEEEGISSVVLVHATKA